MQRALGLDRPAGEDEDDDGQPAGMAVDGEAYLRRVAREADKLKDVTVAANKEQLLSRNPIVNRVVSREKCPAPEGYLPTQAWQERQVKEFSQTRLKLERHLAWVSQNAEEAPSKDVMLPGKDNEKGEVDFPRFAPLLSAH